MAVEEERLAIEVWKLRQASLIAEKSLLIEEKKLRDAALARALDEKKLIAAEHARAATDRVMKTLWDIDMVGTQSRSGGTIPETTVSAKLRTAFGVGANDQLQCTVAHAFACDRHLVFTESGRDDRATSNGSKNGHGGAAGCGGGPRGFGPAARGTTGSGGVRGAASRRVGSRGSSHMKLCATRLAAVPFDPPLVVEWAELDVGITTVPSHALDGVVATIKAARPDPPAKKGKSPMAGKVLPTKLKRILPGPPSPRTIDATTAVPTRMEQWKQQLQTRHHTAPHQCPVCEETYSRRSSAVQHIVTMHMGEKRGFALGNVASYLRRLDGILPADVKPAAARRELCKREIFALQQLTSQRQPMSWVQRRVLTLCSCFPAANRSEAYAVMMEQLVSVLGDGEATLD